jgi:hypothetical protein
MMTKVPSEEEIVISRAEPPSHQQKGEGRKTKQTQLAGSNDSFLSAIFSIELVVSIIGVIPLIVYPMTFSNLRSLVRIALSWRCLLSTLPRLLWESLDFDNFMKESFNKITHTNNSVTEKLLEDDLQKKIEDISKSRKISISNFDDKPSGSGFRGN